VILYRCDFCGMTAPAISCASEAPRAPATQAFGFALHPPPGWDTPYVENGVRHVCYRASCKRKAKKS
jgi:hypothetical protein